MFFLVGAAQCGVAIEARRGGRGVARRSKSRRSRKEVNKLRILLLINACFAFGSNFFFSFFFVSGDNFRP